METRNLTTTFYLLPFVLGFGEAINPPAASWDQSTYLEMVLIYIPLSKLVSPLVFIAIEVIHFVKTHRAIAHVKGKGNFLIL